MTIELLPPPILFDNHIGNLVDALVGGEALLAGEALTTPPDGIALFALAGIDDAILYVPAEGTSHFSRQVSVFSCQPFTLSLPA